MQMMEKKRMFCILVVCILVYSSGATASGLFPGTNDLFGVTMPSIRFAIQREADETIELEDGGCKEIYHHFSYDDYIMFGKYLGEYGAKLKEYSSDTSSFEAAVIANDSVMHFAYNWEQETGEVIYSIGTRVEKESKINSEGDNIFPPTAGIMPSAQFAILQKPDKEESVDDGIMQYYFSFGDEQYMSFSEYLGMTGASLQKYQIENGILLATLGLNGFSFSIRYDWKAKEASVFYPIETTPEKEKWNVLCENDPILPNPNAIGKELPRISQAIKRIPDSTDTLLDGGTQEIYSNFSETDYYAFSQYLLSSDCKVDDYRTENGKIFIELSNATGEFTFSYDALRHEAKVVYPAKTRIEKAWAPTPTIQPTATPAPTEYVVNAHYSEYECWLAAERYFKNLTWKNPSSLTIHGYTSSYDSSNGQYLFTIDYSAMNGFGGYNREYYWVTVSAVTGRVVYGFGSN